MMMEEPEIPSESTRALPYKHGTYPTHENRLSIPFGIRFPAAAGVAFITGLSLGLSHGSKTSGLRFRAENSHRFPTTSTGWYLYHKSKNYHMMLGGIKEGLKMGSRVAFWGGGFFLVEEAIDRLRGSKDFISTLIAGLSISGGFSAWSKCPDPWITLIIDYCTQALLDRFPLPTAGRTIKTGLYSGLVFGFAQDALGLARGRRLHYLDLIMGTSRNDSDAKM